jgi:hypothetical protein
LTPVRAGLLGLAGLVAAMFLDLLVAPGAQMLGAGNTDVALQFMHWRAFGFEELARGNLALWNPHVYAGAPFFGGMQAALLYPPNWLFLALPLAAAMNWTIALNVWLLGAFTYLWGLRRGLLPLAAFVAAALAMFCAPHFLRLHAGHITAMAAMAWAPLIFLALDAWRDSRRPAWLLAGSAAVALQVLAGHPQTVYLTALGAGIYSILRKEIVGIAVMYAGGAALAAVQLFAGFQATSETLRDRAMPFELALYFSFPTENLLTLVAPGFFGDVAHHPYWGRWYLWEASAFIGVTGLALAVYGMARGSLAGKGALAATAAAAALVALGDDTPLFRWLFEWLPLFDRFRGAGKFIFVAALMLVLFAGSGMDRILRDRGVPRGALWAAALTALALAAAALVLSSLDWRALAGAVLNTRQTYLAGERYGDEVFLLASRSFATLGVALAAVTLGVAAGLLAWARWQPRAALLVAALAVAEVFAFARLNRASFDSRLEAFPEVREFLARTPGEYRTLTLARPNSALSTGALDAWGYDPGLTRRYAEFLNWSVGNDPADATAFIEFRRFHPLLAMLRVKYVVLLENRAPEIHPGAVPPLARLELIGAHQVRAAGKPVLEAMGAPGFDPRAQVVLEREPVPPPVPTGPRGRARILREGTDFMDIAAEIETPSVLLVTDVWTPGWRASALAPDDARRYELVPANHTLRAVALERGRHLLRIEYAPPLFLAGKIVSMVALAAWLAAAAYVWRRPRRA